MRSNFLSLKAIDFSIATKGKKGQKASPKQILKDITLDIAQDEFVSFLGPSGCGKTTLLNIIAGFNTPTSGELYQDGQNITQVPVDRRHFGMVFQNYALFPNLSVKENILFGLPKVSKSEREARVNELLSLIDLEAHRDKKPHELSGGQQQRVALARALAPRPKLLLLDEPLSALDAKIRVQLRSDLRLLQKRLGIPVIMVTHDQEEAMAVSDRIVLLHEGQIAQVDTPENLYFKPINSFVADFIGAVNFVKLAEWHRAPARLNQVNQADQSNRADQGESAIRYEHLEVEVVNEATLAKPRRIAFQLFDQQFMGAFYRLTLLHPDQSTFIYADIAYSEFHEKGLGTEKYVAISPKPGMMMHGYEA